MTRDSDKAIIDRLMLYYQHALSDEQIDQWYKLLRDLPDDAAVKGTEHLLKTRRYTNFPSVAELRGAAALFLFAKTKYFPSSKPNGIKKVIFECENCKEKLLYEDLNGYEWSSKCRCGTEKRVKVEVIESHGDKKDLKEILKNFNFKSVN